MDAVLLLTRSILYRKFTIIFQEIMGEWNISLQSFLGSTESVRPKFLGAPFSQEIREIAIQIG